VLPMLPARRQQAAGSRQEQAGGQAAGRGARPPTHGAEVLTALAGGAGRRAGLARCAGHTEAVAAGTSQTAGKAAGPSRQAGRQAGRRAGRQAGRQAAGSAGPPTLCARRQPRLPVQRLQRLAQRAAGQRQLRHQVRRHAAAGRGGGRLVVVGGGCAGCAGCWPRQQPLPAAPAQQQPLPAAPAPPAAISISTSRRHPPRHGRQAVGQLAVVPEGLSVGAHLAQRRQRVAQPLQVARAQQRLRVAGVVGWVWLSGGVGGWVGGWEGAARYGGGSSGRRQAGCCGGIPARVRQRQASPCSPPPHTHTPAPP
jgi:hypothetical protein